MSTPLDSEAYVNVETFKKNGAGVKTPVWAAALDGKLVFSTESGSYKVKRIQNNPRVRVAACNGSGSKIKGPWYDGVAKLLEGPQAEKAEAALARKYGLQRKLFYVFAKLFGRINPKTQCWVEITVGEAAKA